MVRLLRGPFGLIRRRPLPSLAVLLLAGVILAAAGVQGWALRDYHDAEKALEEDRLADAGTDVNFCLAVWPGSADAHLLAVSIDRLNGAFPEAEAQLDECRRLGALTARTEREALLLRAERGEADPADPDPAGDRELCEAAVRGDMRQSHYARARNLLDRCLERWPNDVRALDWRGWLLERLGRPEKAVKDYERALELAPGRAEVRLRLSLIYLDYGNPVLAEPHLQILGKAEPDRPEVLLGLARCRFLQGRGDEARGLLDRVLAARPEEPIALLYRGRLEMQGRPPRPEAAEPYFRRALRVAPNDVEGHYALYDSLRAQPGREVEAAAELERYNELFAVAHRIQILTTAETEHPSDSPEPAYELGKLNLERGDADAGRYWLQDVALARDPHHRPTHALLADFYAKIGDEGAAARERALAGKD